MFAPVVAWNLTGSPARTKLLTIDGLSVLKNPGFNTYGVDPLSISMTEAGPGTVSSLGFTITDPAAEITIAPGQFVAFWDVTLDLPIFTGWIESVAASRLGVGRSIAVSCIGIEVLLDWMYVPAFTLPIGTEFYSGFQTIIAKAGGVGYAMNTNASPGGGTSSTANPIGFGFGMGTALSNAIAIPGGSVRQALQVWADAVLGTFGPDITGTHKIVFTVDFYGGLRIYRRQNDANSYTLADVPQIQLKSVGGGTQGYPSNTSFGLNGSGIPHQVYVNGGAPSAQEFFSDGTGIVGPTFAASDSNATTRAQASAIAFGRLPGLVGTADGEVTAEGGATLGTFAFQKRAMGPLNLQDVQAGIPTATSYWVTSIDKAWARSGEETWVIHFGGAVKRGSQYLRRLTAGVIQ